jgi:hypothetical protein
MSATLLFVTISSEPRFKLIVWPEVTTSNEATWPDQEVRVGGEVFTLIRGSDEAELNGFYDFLRTSNGEVVGIRFLPIGDFDFVSQTATAGQRLRIQGHHPPSLLIFFDQHQNYNDADSDDQEFGYNFLYGSPTGQLAVTFSLERLSKGEMNSILRKVGSVAHPSGPDDVF